PPRRLVTHDAPARAAASTVGIAFEGRDRQRRAVPHRFNHADVADATDEVEEHDVTRLRVAVVPAARALVSRCQCWCVRRARHIEDVAVLEDVTHAVRTPRLAGLAEEV